VEVPHSLQLFPHDLTIAFHKFLSGLRCSPRFIEPRKFLSWRKQWKEEIIENTIKRIDDSEGLSS